MAQHGEPRSDLASEAISPHEEGPSAAELASTALAGDSNPELLVGPPLMRRMLRYLGIVEQTVGSALIVMILVLVLVQVAQRYLPGEGWPWTGEVARLGLVWCTFALIGYLVARDRHIAIHVVDLVLPARVLAVVKVFDHFVVGATCLAMVYATYTLIADDIGQRTPAAQIPLAWIYVVPLVGFLLAALRSGLALFVDVQQVAGGREAAR